MHRPCIARKSSDVAVPWPAKGSLLQSVGYGENEIRLRGGRNADMMKKALQEPPSMLFFAVCLLTIMHTGASE